MLQVNEIFKNAVEQDSRTFKARVVLGKDIFEGIKSFCTSCCLKQFCSYQYRRSCGSQCTSQNGSNNHFSRK